MIHASVFEQNGQNDRKQYPVHYFSEICTVPRAFTEDKEGPDVLYKDGMNTGNKH